MSKLVTYVFLSYNPTDDLDTTELILASLRSLIERRDPEIEDQVIVFDNGSGPRHRGVMKSAANLYDLDIWCSQKNLGISRGFNFAARNVRSEFLSIVTCDTIFTKGLDSEIVEAMLADEQIYQAVPVSDTVQVALQRYQPEDRFGFGADKVLKPANRGVIDIPCVEYTIIYWPRRIFDTVGYWDERWKACFECNDFALRCFLDGGYTAIVPDAFCWHFDHMALKKFGLEKAYDDCPSHKDKTWDEMMPQLHRQWVNKWSPNVDALLPRHSQLNGKRIEDFPEFRERFARNRYMPYVQEVEY